MTEPGGISVEQSHREIYRRWLTEQLQLVESDDVAVMESRLIDLNVLLRERLVQMRLTGDRLITEFAALDTVTREFSRAIHDLPPEPIEDQATPAARPARDREPGSIASGRTWRIALAALAIVAIAGFLLTRKGGSAAEDDRNAARPVPFAPNLHLVRGFPDIEAGYAWTQAGSARLTATRTDPAHKRGYIAMFSHGLGGLDQSIKVLIDGVEVKQFQTGGKQDKFDVEFPWPSDRESVTIDIKADPLIQPAVTGSPDKRNLGIAVQSAGARP